MVTREQRIEAIARHLFDSSGQERFVGDWEMLNSGQFGHVRQSYIDEAETIVDADPITKEVGHDKEKWYNAVNSKGEGHVQS